MENTTLHEVLKGIANSIRKHKGLDNTDENKIKPTDFYNIILLFSKNTLAPSMVDNDGTGFSVVENLTISGEIDGAKILSKAFSNAGIKTLVINEGVTEIGSDAFFQCSSLESVNFPETLEILGGTCFNFCSKITSIEIPSSVNSIAASFINCSGLEQIVVNSANQKYKSDGYNAIIDEEGTFEVYDSETGTLVPATGQVFVVGCKESEIPSYIKALGGSCFYGHPIQYVSLPDGLISIGTFAFRDSSIVELYIPNTVTTIRQQAFASSKINEVTIPDSVIYLGNYMFQLCSSLTEVTYSKNLKTVPSNTFLSCTKLNKVTFHDDSVLTTISGNAFNGCSALTELVFPKSLTAINGTAFVGCTGMVKYDFTKLTTVPTLGSSIAFDDANNNMRIVVLDGLIEDWKAADNWNVYANKIVTQEEYDSINK